jgi:2-oxoglutarate dehydrogenase E1 component
MTRQASNDEFERTSFLSGANAAYIEDLQARYERDPGSVSSDWQAFFRDIKDSSGDVARSARGASWKRDHWPVPANGELVSALDGDWGPLEVQVGEKLKQTAQARGVELTSDDVNRATRDSVRALMMIRA